MDVEPRLCSYLMWRGNLETIGEWCDNETVGGEEGSNEAEFCTVHVNAMDAGYDPNEYLYNGADEL